MLGMSEDGDGLIKCDAGKPFEKLIDCCSRFQVFEQSFYRHTSAAKNPRATDCSFLPLNFRAIAPIQHDDMLFLASASGKHLKPFLVGLPHRCHDPKERSLVQS